MLDLQKVHETKDKIIEGIKANGPSYPAKVARETGVSPLFIAALLSELVSEKKLTMSSMRIGSSPLYYISGQETLLENFITYLNSKEKEAVMRLKESRILDDEKEEPALRVALRKIKDFAIPLTVRLDAEEKLFWKFFSVNNDEAKEMIDALFSPIPQPIPKPVQKDIQKEIIPVSKEIIEEHIVEKKEPKKAAPKKASPFAKTVQDYLQTQDIELLHEVSVKPKEYHAKIRIDTPFGKQEYLLIAKDKKKITEDDLAIALHKAQAEKMPSYILSSGALDKSAQAYLESWKNLIKVSSLE